MFKAKGYQPLFDKIEDHPQKFPSDVYLLLQEIDLLSITFPEINDLDKSSSSIQKQTLLDFLFEIGRGNLSLGRIIEGHINALLLINVYGTKNQKEKYFKLAKEGNLFGIWNTELPKEKVRIRKKEDDLVLKGAKSFCTGALNLQFAIVTARIAKKAQMLIMDIDSLPQLEADWSLWDPMGMRASVSCRIDFTGIEASENQFLGKPNDYYKEPYFSWGGARFSAVQLGAAQKIVDDVLNDLSKNKRTDDPYQKIRLGKLALLMKTAELWISEASRIERQSENEISTLAKVNFANMIRTIALDISSEVIAIAGKAVGVQATMKNHPLEQTIRDLRVYLKQAGPDAALASVGHFTALNKK